MSKKIILISFLAGVLGITTLTFHFSESINLSTISLSKFNTKGASPGFVTCPLNANIGSDMLRMELNFKASDKKQKAALKKIIPIVQSEFMMNADTASLQKIIQERNFEAIKAFVLKTINQHCTIPVKSVYFNSFNLIRTYPT
jgi:flagellar basal body-associated protein FliL